MEKGKLLIVDDEGDILEGMRRMLAYELQGVEIQTTTSGRSALQMAGSGDVDLLLVDVRMPEMDGFELIDALKSVDPQITVIMMTAYGSIDVAVEAMKRGAYDFVTKPFEKESLVRVLEKGLERNRLVRENVDLKRRMAPLEGFHGLVGRSLPMQTLYDRIQIAAPTDYTVLVRGQSGTGKELVARALHALSKRAAKPIITVNCPAIPEHLLESELFGHRRGAFTGADRDHQGLFQEADGGTLFLDEIGDIPISVQTKLLRVLQEQEIRPLGCNATLTIDVRIIASTNRPIEDKIREGSFREDLFYRLNVVPIQTPSLNQIRADIPLLAAHYSSIACAELDTAVKRFTPCALEYLSARPWPGNIRELQNAVRRAVIFSPGGEISREDLRRIDQAEEPGGRPDEGGADEPEHHLPYRHAKERLVNRFSREYVTALLDRTGGNVTRAADMSGLERASFQKIMRRFGIRSDTYKKNDELV